MDRTELVAGAGRGRLAGWILAAAVCVGLATATAADAYVYWVDGAEDAGAIGRVNLDGTGVDRGFITGLDEPCGVAVDDQHIYWGERGTNSIGRANLDGTAVNRTFISQPGTVAAPCGPAIGGGLIWWANGGGGGGQGSIARANLDGTDLRPTFFNSPTSAANPLSIALGGDFVFWANLDNDLTVEPSIGRAGAPEPPPVPLRNFIGPTDPQAPFWLAADESHLYFVLVFGQVFPSGLVRSNLDGTGIDPVTPTNAAGGVALHGGRLYWANIFEGTISRANPDGSNPDFAFIRGVGEPFGLAVDAEVPGNDLEFAGLKRNKRKGTAKLTVEVPGAGSLELGGNGIKPVAADAQDAGAVELAVVAKGSKKTRLKRKGKVKLEAEVTFSPVGGTPNTEATKVKLVRK